LEQSYQRQNEKKQNLLSRARIATNIRKKVRLSAPKVTEQQKFLDHLEFWRKCEWNLSCLSQVVEDMNSNERFKQHRGTIGARKILSNDISLIQKIIDANLVPRMVEFLQFREEPQLQVKI